MLPCLLGTHLENLLGPVVIAEGTRKAWTPQDTRASTVATFLTNMMSRVGPVATAEQSVLRNSLGTVPGS